MSVQERLAPSLLTECALLVRVERTTTEEVVFLAFLAQQLALVAKDKTTHAL